MSDEQVEKARNGTVQVHDFIHFRMIDGDLLVFTESDRVHRLSGPLAPVARKVLEFLQVPRSEEDVGEVFAEEAGAELGHVIQTLDDLALLKWDKRYFGLTEDQMISHRLLVNHFAASSHLSEVGRRARQVIEARVAIVGVGLLGTRLAVALASAGVRGLHIMGEDLGISDEDRRASPTYAQAPCGSSKLEFLAEQFPNQFPSCEFTFSADVADHLDEDVHINVIALDVYDDAYCRSINDRAVDTGVCWLLCALSKGTGILVSFRPNDGACYTCYRSRINGNVADAQLLAHELDVRSLMSQLQVAFLPTIDVVAGVAAHEVLTLLPYLPEERQSIFDRRMRAVSDEDYQESQRQLIVSEPLTWSSEVLVGGSPLRIERHSLVRLPRCPSCGTTKTRRVPSTPWVMPL